MECGAAKPLVL